MAERTADLLLTPPSNPYFRRAFALATTFSTVKPNSLRQVPPGAEAPKRFMVTLSPSKPMKRCQPKDSAASTTMRLRTALAALPPCRIGLLVEKLDTGHGDHAHLLAFSGSCLAAWTHRSSWCGADQDQIGSSSAVLEDVTTQGHLVD